jgi:hypothetical protein
MIGSVTERLDEQKLTVLRRWGEGLASDEREEVRAAGRAILLMSDEIERLHVDLWHAREQREPAGEPAPAEMAQESSSDWPRTAEQLEIGKALRDRITAFRLSKRD